MQVAWPAVADVLRALPLDSFEDSAGKLTATDVQRSLGKWKRALSPSGEASAAPLNEATADIVLLGARADSLEQLYTGTGYEQMRAAQGMRVETVRMINEYLEGRPAVQETASSKEYVENFTEQPSWVGGEHPRFRDPYRGYEEGAPWG